MYIKVSYEEAARLFARGCHIYDDIVWGTCFATNFPTQRKLKSRELRALTRKMRRWDWNNGLYVYKKA